MPKAIAAAELPALLRPGMTVYVQGSTGQPTALFEALQAAPEASRDVHYVGCLLPGVNDIDPSDLHETVRLTTFFQYGTMGDPARAHRVRFMPQHYSGIWAYLSGLEPIDVALIQVAPPVGDAASLGCCVDFQPAILDRAKTVVAEINRQMPVPPRAPTIPLSRLDYVAEVDHPLPQVVGGAPGPTLARIAAHVADIVKDGDTVQCGIGKLPAAILAALAGRRDIGVQGGMVADAMVDLAVAGTLTGARKSIDAGLHVCGAALGTEKVYDWVREREDVLFMPVGYTHDVRVISQLDNFVSVNSVLEVDLTGQANAETVNGRQISGTGGLVDFVRGARMSKGGRSVIALPATAAGGEVSRIVARLSGDAVVSCPRADIDYVVTEYGAAHLSPLAIAERGPALIEIAAPAFRDELRRAL
jgi:4-hydroxybutyrate CoA-transferase